MDMFELLLHKIQQERIPFETYLLAGKAVDHADYMHVSGVLRGLNLIDELIKDLAQRQKDADNE